MSDNECNEDFHNVAWGLDCQVEQTKINFSDEKRAEIFLNHLLIYIRFKYSVVEAAKDVCYQEEKSVILPQSLHDRIITIQELLDLAKT
jgi:hypothetical protein